jgi:lysophospholipase L1-like esterase
MISTKSALVLKKNDRIVFLGDSITEQHLYTNYVESYLSARYSALNLSFFNAGWGGDTAPGGVQRLQRDVLSLNPTVVTICYGMNDGSYCPMNAGILQRYAAGMSELVRLLKKAKVRVILLTPGMADHARNQELKAINYSGLNLRRLADFVLGLAKRESLPVGDIHHLMTEVDARAKQVDREFTMIPDSIHPDPAGHLVMAHGLLQALGVSPLLESAEIDLTAGKAVCSKGFKISDIQPHQWGYEFNLKPDCPPFFVEPAARKILPFLPFQETYNNLRLSFRGGRAERYYFKSGAVRTECLSLKDLKSGIGLSSLWQSAPVQAMGQFHQFTAEKNQIYFRLWRLIALEGKSGPDYNEVVHRTAQEAMPLLEKARTALLKKATNPCCFRMLAADLPGEPLENDDFISCWSFRGPFVATARTEGRDFLGGEAKMTEIPPVLSREWTEGNLNIENPNEALNAFFGPHENCCAYLLTVIESPIHQTAELRVGSDDGFAAWFNGKCLANRIELRRGLAIDQDRLPVTLRKGANVLMLKVSQGVAGWGVCTRFAGLSQPVLASRAKRKG